MKSCFMFRESLGSGGNIIPANRIIVRRTAAFGDCLSSTVVCDKLAEQGYSVTFQCHPDIQQLIRRCPSVDRVENPSGVVHVNLDGAYEQDPFRRKKHFTQTWIDTANRQLAKIGINLGNPINCRPFIRVSELEKESARLKFKSFPRPWVFICPRSDSYVVRQVQDGVWKEAAKKIEGTKFWIGRHLASEGFIDLKSRKFDDIVVWLSVSDLLVTVDTGPLHVAAALGVPIVAIGQSSSPEYHLNDQTDFITIEPANLSCLNCVKTSCPVNPVMPPCQNISPDVIAEAANRKLKYFKQDAVSAVIPIYKPEVQVLNKCLDYLLPQVDEIIVSLEAKSILPAGHRIHSKIQYVKTWRSGIGYGPNMNHGVRHSSNRWLLLINDDVFLPPGTVDKLKKHAVPGIGVIAHQLRFLDGTIYPVAMMRSPGDRDWRHIDYRAKHSSIHNLTEMDTCCGASILVPRKAFYEVGGFDESYFLYCEDTDFVLRIRSAGYKAIFNPQIEGTHINGESSKKVGRTQNEMIVESGKKFHAKWDSYLAWNINRPIGNFDYDK